MRRAVKGAMKGAMGSGGGEGRELDPHRPGRPRAVLRAGVPPSRAGAAAGRRGALRPARAG